MTNRYRGIALLLFFISCTETQNGIPLSEFTFNGESRNEWIVNRIPDYGTGKRDGCEILKEISFHLEAAGDKFTGRIYDSKSDSGLAKAKVMIQYTRGSAPAETFSDQNGIIDFTSDGSFEKLIIWQAGYRSLIVQTQNKKLQARVN